MSGPASPSTSANPSFTFDALEPSTFECSFSTGADAFSACTSPQAYTAQPNGTYTFSVRATDVAGNSGIASRDLTIAASPGPGIPSVPDLAGRQ